MNGTTILSALLTLVFSAALLLVWWRLTLIRQEVERCYRISHMSLLISLGSIGLEKAGESCIAAQEQLDQWLSREEKSS